MIAAMSVLPAIHRERVHADEQMRTIHHIRVTVDALPGSVVSVPITPERARTIALRAFPASGGDPVVDTDPELVGRPLLEVLIHPEDWMTLLKDAEAIGYVDTSGPIRRVMGIPVVDR